MCIYILILRSRIKAAELAFNRAHLGSWLTVAPCPQDAEVSSAECPVPPAHGGQAERSSPARVKSLGGYLTSAQGRVRTSEHF